MRAVTTFQAANFYFWGKIPFCRYPLQFWKVKQSSEECRYPATALGGLTLRLHGARQDKSSQGRVGERDAGGGSCVALITEMKCCRRAAASPFSGWGMWEATASMRMVPLHHEVPLHQMRRRCCPEPAGSCPTSRAARRMETGHVKICGMQLERCLEGCYWV